jgi:hypothetical protein
MYMQSEPASRATDCMTARQLQVLNTVRRLWIEHVMWTRSFIVSTTFGTADLNDVTKRLLRNPADFAAVLKPFYGAQAATAFEKLFTAHLQIAAQLVNAAKAGDSAAIQQERQKWYANADEIAAFLAGANPYWSQASWQAMLYDHLKMTENEAVQMLTGKYADSIAQYDAIQNEALEMADMLAQGIILQFRL